MTKLQEIKEAFENIISGGYDSNDVDIILENKDNIYTFEESMNCEDCLSEGRNGYDIVDRLARTDRAKKSYEDDWFYFREGKLIDILNEEAIRNNASLPLELAKNGPYNQTVAFEGKELCDRQGYMYTLIGGRYVSKFCITGNQVDEIKEKKTTLSFKVFDIVDGRDKMIEYSYEDMEINFDDELDYDKGYKVYEEAEYYGR